MNMNATNSPSVISSLLGLLWWEIELGGAYKHGDAHGSVRACAERLRLKSKAL